MAFFILKNILEGNYIYKSFYFENKKYIMFVNRKLVEVAFKSDYKM